MFVGTDLGNLNELGDAKIMTLEEMGMSSGRGFSKLPGIDLTDAGIIVGKPFEQLYWVKLKGC